MSPRLPNYAVGCHTKFPGFNYNHPRPLRFWTDSQIDAAIRNWLQCDPPWLELTTLAHHELQVRGCDLNAGMAFVDAQVAPVGWLIEAGHHVRKVFAPELLRSQKSGRLGAHVYVMLRHGYSSASGTYGAYVGSTGKSPTRRCTEHRRGVRAARGLQRYGIEPLWSLFDFINPVPANRAGREKWETRLHEALAQIVPKVTGDVAF